MSNFNDKRNHLLEIQTLFKKIIKINKYNIKH